MSGNRFDQLSPDELDYVDDKTAALLLNTPHSARILLWVMAFSYTHLTLPTNNDVAVSVIPLRFNQLPHA